MKLRILRSLGRGLPDWTEGQEVTVKDTTLGKSLMDRGLAEQLGEPEPAKEPKPPEAIPKAKKEAAKRVPNTVASTPKKKPAEKPVASEVIAGQKEPAAAPVKPEAEKAADKSKTIEATVKNSEEYEHRTGFGGDEQGASIKVQADHFEMSEIIRGPSTGFEPVYKYKAKSGYVGKDSVELELVDHQLGDAVDDPGKTTKTRLVINFTVVK